MRNERGEGDFGFLIFVIIMFLLFGGGAWVNQQIQDYKQMQVCVALIERGDEVPPSCLEFTQQDPVISDG